MGKDLGTTAVAAVESVINTAKSVGVNTTKATQEAVVGAITAADRIGSEAGQTVRNALSTAASLPKDVVQKVIKKAPK